MEFLEIFGLVFELKLVVEIDVYEGGVYYFDNNEFYYLIICYKVGYMSMIILSDEKDFVGE